jgi:hypothetical protein
MAAKAKAAELLANHIAEPVLKAVGEGITKAVAGAFSANGNPVVLSPGSDCQFPSWILGRKTHFHCISLDDGDSVVTVQAGLAQPERVVARENDPNGTVIAREWAGLPYNVTCVSGKVVVWST